jgi:Mg2+ and Co2+ transporter CorA
LTTINNVVEGAWVHVVNPTPDEIEKTYGLGIPQAFITSPLRLDEEPRTERKAGSTLILLRSPYSGSETQNPATATIPLGIVLCSDFIITISRYDIPILDIDGKKTRSFSTTKRNQFLLQIFSSVVNEFVDAISEIARKIDQADLSEMSDYRMRLNQLSVSLKGNGLVLEKLKNSTLFTPCSDDANLLSVVIAENRQAIDMAAGVCSLLLEKMGASPALV